MVDGEVKKVVYTAIECIEIVLVLGLIASILVLRTDFASVRRDERRSTETVQNYRKFNGYGDTVRTGLDAINLIRENLYDDITVFVGKANGETLVEDVILTKRDAMNNKANYSTEKLMMLIDTEKKYDTYLVYNYVDIKACTLSMIKSMSSNPPDGCNVSGVCFVEKES